MIVRSAGNSGVSMNPGCQIRPRRERSLPFGCLTTSGNSPILVRMTPPKGRPRWDDPDTFGARLPPDYNPRGVFAEGPQPPTNPLGKLQGGRAGGEQRDALPANVARVVLSRAGKVRQRLKLALFTHKPNPPTHPIITSVRYEPDERDATE